ncbi:hypothetical protein NQ314_005031 [Rhamnusium bicolor]|uniref:Uncharacterized protein n=1 Tax=Rhamnusium bicolor TaxID=1586634 RepID=A0AAV8ZIG2_9CUCU|nr:hypothetical protein NQ314_005031 [Rhamnusium bicolor]
MTQKRTISEEEALRKSLGCYELCRTPNMRLKTILITLNWFANEMSTIAASFLIIYPFAGELYPTQLRGLGIGTSAYIAGLGLIIIPFITYLGSEMLILPLIIMGGVSVVGGLSGLRLPETLHHRLPQTVEEGEEFGNGFTMTDCLRCIPIR